MKIMEIMNREVDIVSPDTSIQEVAKKIHQRDGGSIIVARNGKLVGMISDKDIALRCVASDHDPVGTTAENLMIKDILYCLETDDVDDVTRKMIMNKMRRLPVLNTESRLVGIVSLDDLTSSH